MWSEHEAISSTAFRKCSVADQDADGNVVLKAIESKAVTPDAYKKIPSNVVYNPATHEARFFTIEELMAKQGFEPIHFTGVAEWETYSKAQKMDILGRAVPPIVADKAIFAILSPLSPGNRLTAAILRFRAGESLDPLLRFARSKNKGGVKFFCFEPSTDRKLGFKGDEEFKRVKFMEQKSDLFLQENGLTQDSRYAIPESRKPTVEFNELFAEDRDSLAQKKFDILVANIDLPPRLVDTVPNAKQAARRAIDRNNGDLDVFNDLLGALRPRCFLLFSPVSHKFATHLNEHRSRTPLNNYHFLYITIDTHCFGLPQSRQIGVVLGYRRSIFADLELASTLHQICKELEQTSISAAPLILGWPKENSVEWPNPDPRTLRTSPNTAEVPPAISRILFDYIAAQHVVFGGTADLFDGNALHLGARGGSLALGAVASITKHYCVEPAPDLRKVLNANLGRHADSRFETLDSVEAVPEDLSICFISATIFGPFRSKGKPRKVEWDRQRTEVYRLVKSKRPTAFILNSEWALETNEFEEAGYTLFVVPGAIIEPSWRQLGNPTVSRCSMVRKSEPYVVIGILNGDASVIPADLFLRHFCNHWKDTGFFSWARNVSKAQLSQSLLQQPSPLLASYDFDRDAIAQEPEPPTDFSSGDDDFAEEIDVDDFVDGHSSFGDDETNGYGKRGSSPDRTSAPDPSLGPVPPSSPPPPPNLDPLLATSPELPPMPLVESDSEDWALSELSGESFDMWVNVMVPFIASRTEGRIRSIEFTVGDLETWLDGRGIQGLGPYIYDCFFLQSKRQWIRPRRQNGRILDYGEIADAILIRETDKSLRDDPSILSFEITERGLAIWAETNVFLTPVAEVCAEYIDAFEDLYEPDGEEDEASCDDGVIGPSSAPDEAGSEVSAAEVVDSSLEPISALEDVGGKEIAETNSDDEVLVRPKTKRRRVVIDLSSDED